MPQHRDEAGGAGEAAEEAHLEGPVAWGHAGFPAEPLPGDPPSGDSPPGDSPPSDPPPPGAPRPRSRLRRVVRWVFLTGLFFSLLAVAGVAGLFAWHARDLPSFESLRDYSPPQVTKLVTPDGDLVGEIFAERRTVVPIDQIPPVVVQALISAEDANFFEHRGVDWVGIIKAALDNLRPGGRLRGASTITQQTVKTFLLSSERKLSRKIKEAILAQRIERNLTKDEILFLYLNQIDFGARRFGIEEASLHYFGKSVRDVELGEAALLAAIPNAPSRLNPRRHLKRARERQAYVLRRMAENGYITAEVAQREIDRPLRLAPLPPRKPGAYYVEEVRRQLVERFGAEFVERAGLRVTVAMNPRAQAAAEEALRETLREVDKRQGYRGPLGKLSEEAWSALRGARGPTAPEEPDPEEREEAAPGGERILDLRHVDTTVLEAGINDPEQLARANRAVLEVPLLPGSEVVARVRAVTAKDAEFDLGGYVGTLALKEAAWARPWRPESATAAPKSMEKVLSPGDLALVRVVSLTSCPSGGKVASNAGAEPKKAEAPCPRAVLALEQEPRVEGALVSIDPATRDVVALVGGYDHRRSPFNRATQALRQPGSAFKPFVYAAALETGRFTPRTVVYDTPELIRDRWTGKRWEPRNFDRDAFAGPLSLRDSLAQSKNTVAVKLVADIGREPGVGEDEAQDRGLAHVREVARRAGIDSPLPQSLTAALGSGEVIPLEFVNAYATLADGGRWSAPALIHRVTDPQGNILYERIATPEQPPLPARPRSPDAAEESPEDTEARPEGEVFPLAAEPVEQPGPYEGRGVRADVAFVLLQMMRSVVESPGGTARSLQSLGRPVAGKTGTASEHRDAWFVGFTSELVAGVWVGFDDHAPLGPRETGGNAAAPAWLRFMKQAQELFPARPWEMPEGVVSVDIDPRTGLLAPDFAPYVEREVFISGTEPTEPSPPPDLATPDDFLRGHGP